MGGYYVLDENGDRDVNFSVIYTSTIDKQYKTLFVFDTSINETRVEDSTPSLPWPGSQLPGDKPINPNGNDTQCIWKLFRPLDFIHIFLIKILINLHTIPDSDKATFLEFLANV
ncbi:unnamed protein product [Oncorhynchus mykiss]|uniref:Uncharacterized protein n=1 Tax=Oncorhynchus mykiss TaxID=8022 RepID=A0A060Z8M7_ONCMY|nr:unnamed protein product [Oncorhynchus mykiss]